MPYSKLYFILVASLVFYGAWVLPVGISFRTFQSMSYTIDVYRGDMKLRRRKVSIFPS